MPNGSHKDRRLHVEPLVVGLIDSATAGLSSAGLAGLDMAITKLAIHAANQRSAHQLQQGFQQGIGYAPLLPCQEKIDLHHRQSVQ